MYTSSSKNSVAFILILVGSFAFGLFGLVSALAESKDYSFLFFTSVSSAMTALIFFCFSKFNGDKAIDIFLENSNDQTVLGCNLLLSLFRMSTFLLILAFVYLENKMVGVGIYEIYPLITVFLSYFFFPKEKDDVKSLLIFVPIILFSVFLVFWGGELSSSNSSNFAFNKNNILGLTIVIVATFFAAANTSLGPHII